jgi:hypothetical protein
LQQLDLGSPQRRRGVLGCANHPVTRAQPKLSSKNLAYRLTATVVDFVRQSGSDIQVLECISEVQRRTDGVDDILTDDLLAPYLKLDAGITGRVITFASSSSGKANR